MSDTELRKVIDKLQKIRALSRARECVRRLERELYGEEAPTPTVPAEVPRFLSQHHPLRVV
jgi:hypothetical protein